MTIKTIKISHPLIPIMWVRSKLHNGHITRVLPPTTLLISTISRMHRCSRSGADIQQMTRWGTVRSTLCNLVVVYDHQVHLPGSPGPVLVVVLGTTATVQIPTPHHRMIHSRPVQRPIRKYNMRQRWGRISVLVDLYCHWRYHRWEKCIVCRGFKQWFRRWISCWGTGFWFSSRGPQPWKSKTKQ